MFRAYLIPVGLLVFGCSSSTTNEASETGGMAGQAGAAGSGSGGSDSGGNSGSGGIAGQAGSNSGGVGNTGGGAGSPSGGGGNSGGTGGGVCVPKTCDTYSFQKTGKIGLACGIITDDGCGNVLDCGTCKNPIQGCGAGPDPSLPTESAIPNICNGKCLATISLQCPKVSGYNDTYKMFCTVNDKSISPILGGYDYFQYCAWTNSFSQWCCSK